MNEIRIPFYFANFTNVDTEAKVSVIDDNSHPFIWMAIQMELGRKYHLDFWKEISEEEYEYFKLMKSKNKIF